MKESDRKAELYIRSLPLDRQQNFRMLRATVAENLPDGFEELAGDQQISYVVPLLIFPDGYHCKPGKPLPFLQLAFRKNYLALYHFGLYASEELLKWWVDEYSKRVPDKLDMGKSCIRFKEWQNLPLGLIAELCGKMTVEEWIDIYKKATRKGL